MIRRQQTDQLTGLQHGQPALYRRSGNADFVSELRHVQELSGAGGDQQQELVESFQIAYLSQIPDVALYISLQITGKPKLPVHLFVQTGFGGSRRATANPQSRDRRLACYRSGKILRLPY